MENRFSVDFEVSNPSPSIRTDYVEINLNELDVPNHLTSEKLILLDSRDSNNPDGVAFQIDYPLGENNSPRILCFKAENIPAGKSDYSSPGIIYRLQSCNQKAKSFQDLCKIEFEYVDKPGIMDINYRPNKNIKGIKVGSNCIQPYFHLAKVQTLSKFKYSGSMTSIEIPKLSNINTYGIIDILFPFYILQNEEKFWGQITEITFPPLPWKTHILQTIELSSISYSYVYHHTGPIRSIAVFRTAPFFVKYDLTEISKNNSQTNIKACLYRSIITYPNITPWFYLEEIEIIPEDPALSLCFSLHFLSKLPPTGGGYDCCWFDHIPDYFSIWRRNFGWRPGYAIASNAYMHNIQIDKDEISWIMAPRRFFRIVHMFLIEDQHFNPFHQVGHAGWYSIIWKPILAKNSKIRYPKFYTNDILECNI